MTPHIDERGMLSYIPLDLSLLTADENGLDAQITEWLASSFPKDMDAALLLQGKGTSFLADLKAFLCLKRKCTEIAYRGNEKEKAILLFSIHENVSVLRPGFIQEVKWLNESEEKTLKKKMRDFPHVKEVNVVSLWGVVSTEMPEKVLAAFSFCIEEVTQGSTEVECEGEVPLLGALWVLNSLAVTKNRIVWNGNVLK